MMPNPNEKKVSMEEDNATGITLTTQGLLKNPFASARQTVFLDAAFTANFTIIICSC